MQSLTRTETVPALCDSACSHSWISETSAAKLLVQGSATKLTVHDFISQEVIDSRMAKLKLIPVHFGDTECSTLTSNRLSESTLVLAMTLSTLRAWNNSTFIWNRFFSNDTVTQTSKWYWVKTWYTRNPTIAVLWNRPKRYFNRRLTSVRFGLKWTTDFDLRIFLYLLQSCYTEWERLHFGR